MIKLAKRDISPEFTAIFNNELAALLTVTHTHPHTHIHPLPHTHASPYEAVLMSF